MKARVGRWAGNEVVTKIKIMAVDLFEQLSSRHNYRRDVRRDVF